MASFRPFPPQPSYAPPPNPNPPPPQPPLQQRGGQYNQNWAGTGDASAQYNHVMQGGPNYHNVGYAPPRSQQPPLPAPHQYSFQPPPPPPESSYPPPPPPSQPPQPPGYYYNQGRPNPFRGLGRIINM